MTVEQFWTPIQAEYQKPIRVVDQPDQPAVAFPLVLTPGGPDDSKERILHEVRSLAAQPGDKDTLSPIRQLLDAHGGAIHFRNLPLRTPQDFSDFLVALAGTGQNSWIPHVHKGSEVLRKPLAEHVMTANE